MPSFQDFAQKALGVLGLGQGDQPTVTAGTATPLGQVDTPESSWVRFEAHGPQWGFAFWSLCPADREALASQSGRGLLLRVVDVTGLAPDQPPHALQELRVDARAGQWGVALPWATASTALSWA